ncbi:MAG: hypothetical protein WCI31_07965 [Prolixibacteraceae bacterium]
MKKIIGIILIAICGINIIGLIYLSSVNPDKVSKNAEYFGKKIVTALIVGGIGVYLVSSSSKNKSVN